MPACTTSGGVIGAGAPAGRDRCRFRRVHEWLGESPTQRFAWTDPGTPVAWTRNGSRGEAWWRFMIRSGRRARDRGVGALGSGAGPVHVPAVEDALGRPRPPGDLAQHRHGGRAVRAAEAVRHPPLPHRRRVQGAAGRRGQAVGARRARVRPREAAGRSGGARRRGRRDVAAAALARARGAVAPVVAHRRAGQRPDAGHDARRHRASEGQRRHLHEADRLEQRLRAERLRPLHLARPGRLDDAGRLQQRQRDHPGAGLRGVPQRDDPRDAHHPARRPADAAVDVQGLHGLFARPLRGQHAGGAHHQPQWQDRHAGQRQHADQQRGAGAHRALHARSARTCCSTR